MEGQESDGAPARNLDGSRGVAWWTDAWALFKPNALMWIVLAILWFVAYAVLGVIPLLGGLVAAVLTPALIASWMMAVRKVQAGGALEVGDLVTAFRGDRLTPLIVLGALMLAAFVVMGVVAGILGAGSVFGLIAGGASHSAGGIFAALSAGMFTLLVCLVLGALIGMAFWFAPGLVVFQNVPPVEAVQASFSASLKNIGPMLVFGLIYIVASIVASIPFGLGWIVLIPVTLITAYTSYTDLFGT